jgi:hypothetical protein
MQSSGHSTFTLSPKTVKNSACADIKPAVGGN